MQCVQRLDCPAPASGGPRKDSRPSGDDTSLTLAARLPSALRRGSFKSEEARERPGPAPNAVVAAPTFCHGKNQASDCDWICYRSFVRAPFLSQARRSGKSRIPALGQTTERELNWERAALFRSTLPLALPTARACGVQRHDLSTSNTKIKERLSTRRRRVVFTVLVVVVGSLGAGRERVVRQMTSHSALPYSFHIPRQGSAAEQENGV
jgi:hypothetical protein